uniref:DUF8039 domain-containing protein n=1 Tax=Leersia perrieri TaxID=77586 RepID=A0A0D9XRG5_9ORYZ
MAINCELHMPTKNLTILVAKGIVSPVDPQRSPPKYHGRSIPPGYGSVAIDMGLALDFPRGDDETTLGEIEHEIVLWRKRYIMRSVVQATIFVS